MRAIRAIAFVACFSATTIGAQGREPYPGLDAYVSGGLRLWEVPGLSLAIVRNDSVIYVKGYGVRELGKSDAVDARTIFAIGSTSKAFTTAALAMLVDDNKVAWDDRVTRHLPWFQMYDPYASREVTVRDLVTHRGGLARGDGVWGMYEYDRDEVVRRVRFLAPSWSLRSTFGYQNLMYVTAGQVVAHASGQSWDDFLRDRIFTPLGMTSTSTSITGFRGNPNVASPHGRVNDTLVATPWEIVDDVGPAGSINSNAVDMAQWVRMHLGRGKFAGKSLISGTQIEEIQTPQMVVRMEGPWKARSPDAHLLAYGLGWFVQDHRGRKLVQHSGNVNAMSAVVGLLPEENFGVVVLSNAPGNLLPNALMYRILDLELRVTPKDYSADMRKQALADAERARRNRPVQVTGTRPSLSPDKYVATYADSLYGQVQVRLVSDTLRLVMGTRGEAPLQHWHYDTYRAVWPTRGVRASLVTFSLDARGNVASLVVDEDGGMTFRRAPASAGAVQASGPPR